MKPLKQIYLEDSLLLKAETIAREAHKNQFRRDKVTPYITHPEDVARRVYNPLEKAVSWLHDVLEDTNITSLDLLKQGIPPKIIEAVQVLTKEKDQPYDEYLKNVKGNEIARIVKIADMKSNLADKPTHKQIEKYTAGLRYLE